MKATTLLGAVTALFDASVALAAAFVDTGGLWVGGIPEERTALPICCLVHHDELPQWLEGVGPLEEGRFDFVLYARQTVARGALAEVERLAGLVKAVFDPTASRKTFTKLTITGCSAAWVIRQGYQVRLVEYRAADSAWVYEITMPYKSYVQH